jgi:predicted esterase
MGGGAAKKGAPWWVPIFGVAVVFGAFVWLGRVPVAPSPEAVALALPATLDAAALVRRPSGTTPLRPVFLLHGSGSSAAKFLDVADEISRQGFAAIVVRAPRELEPGRYTWSSVDETHVLLQHTLTLARSELALTSDRPLLIGYSLGATQAVRLLAEHPDAYASAFAIAPGPIGDAPLPPSKGGRPLAVLVGEQDAPSSSAVDRIERAWTAAHEPIWIDRHPGDHRPPDDWRARFDDAMTWMLVKASS